MNKFTKKVSLYFIFRGLFYGVIVGFAIASEFVDDESDINSFLTPFLISIVLCFIVGIIWGLLYYRISGYRLTENGIECKSGVLFKKNSILDYKKIHAINKKANIICQLLKITLLTIDSGSANTGRSAEIAIYIDSDKVDALIDEIKLHQNGEFNSSSKNIEVNDKEYKELYNFEPKSKWALTLINVFACFVIFALVIGFIVSFVSLLSKYINFEDSEEFTSFDFVVSITISLVSIMIFTFIGFVIQCFVGYYNFKVYRIGDELNIDYGLLTKNHNVFKVNRVKAVKIKQSLFQRLFGYASVSLEVIGYIEGTGNDANKAIQGGVLIPLCKYDLVKFYLSEILPEYVCNSRDTLPQYIFPFISYRLLISLSIDVILCVLTAYFIKDMGVMLVIYSLILLLTGCVIIDGLLCKKHSGISISGNDITVFHGGFTKKITLINAKHVIGIERVTTKYRKENNIYSYIIHIRTNEDTNTILVNNLDEKTYDRLLEVVKY